MEKKSVSQVSENISIQHSTLITRFLYLKVLEKLVVIIIYNYFNLLNCPKRRKVL